MRWRLSWKSLVSGARSRVRPLAARESSPLQLLARDLVLTTDMPASIAWAGTGDPGLAFPMMRTPMENACVLI